MEAFHPANIPRPFTVFVSFFGSIIGCLGVINLIPRRDTVFDVGHYLYRRIPNSYEPEYLIAVKALMFLMQDPCYFCFFQFLWLASLFLWARMALMWITTLPYLNHRDHIPFYGLVGGFNDFLPFSGHTAASLLLSLFMAPKTGPIVYLTDIWLCYLLIAMRRHYTIEIVLSLLFTYWLKIEA